MSPFVLIALAALLGFIVGWFAHGPKEESGSGAKGGPASLASEVSRLGAKVDALETTNRGLEAMVHGRDATIALLTRD